MEDLTNSIASTVIGDKSVRRCEINLHAGPKRSDNLCPIPPRTDLQL